jgi:hypothetical protein
MGSDCMSFTPGFPDDADEISRRMVFGIHLRKLDSHGPKPGFAPNAAGDETLPF